MIEIQITIDNLNINYIKKGEGKSVIILPGWGASTSIYDCLINEISKYACVYCIDMPGVGESQEMSKSWNIQDYVNLVINFINSQKLKDVTLIGHSNGGRIIIKLLSDKKYKFKINKAILIGSAGIKRKKNFKQKLKIKVYKLCRKFLELKIFNGAFKGVVDKMRTTFGSDDYRNATPVMRQTLVNLVETDLTNCLKYVDVPTLLIWGTADDATPITHAKIMEKQIPDAGLVEIKDGSHYVFLEQPIYINRIIKVFLEE